MTVDVRMLLPLLLICALPSLGLAADPAPATETAAQAAPAVPPSPAPAPAVKQTVKIGYVDMAKAGAESNLGKALRAKVQEKQKKLQAQIEGRRKQLDKQKAALEAKFAGLAPAQREAKAKEFQKKVEEFQKFGLNAEKELQTMQEGLSSELYTAIEQAATEYGRSNALALIVVKRELLYIGSGVDAQDVTDGVLTLLNARKQ